MEWLTRTGGNWYPKGNGVGKSTDDLKVAVKTEEDMGGLMLAVTTTIEYRPLSATRLTKIKTLLRERRFFIRIFHSISILS